MPYNVRVGFIYVQIAYEIQVNTNNYNTDKNKIYL